MTGRHRMHTRFSVREPMFTWFRFIARCVGRQCQHPPYLLTTETKTGVLCKGCWMIVANRCRGGL